MRTEVVPHNPDHYLKPTIMVDRVRKHRRKLSVEVEVRFCRRKSPDPLIPRHFFVDVLAFPSSRTVSYKVVLAHFIPSPARALVIGVSDPFPI